MTYLVSPYSHPDWRIRELRFDQACEFAAKLMAKGEHVYSPIAHTHPIAMAGELPKDWSFWREYDSWFIERCDKVVVLMLDGWKESVGVKAEIEIATRLGKPVEYVTGEE